ncbi:tyrosine-type recombinase/integrase [Peribacillus sp. NPDC097225]|uniref:tyrosine-type recombinase/integrase n=1 Tax=Peribacillus sp. NPDC097225 TaxID=3364400 RepID=UPI003814D9CE
MALFTGMRGGEILALRWNNVDLEKGVIHVAEALARTKAHGLKPKEVKTTHSERAIFLSPSLTEALTIHKQHQTDNPLDLVFPSKKGTYIESRNLLRMYKSLTEKADVPYILFIIFVIHTQPC